MSQKFNIIGDEKGPDTEKEYDEIISQLKKFNGEDYPHYFEMTNGVPSFMTVHRRGDLKNFTNENNMDPWYYVGENVNGKQRVYVVQWRKDSQYYLADNAGNTYNFTNEPRKFSKRNFGWSNIGGKSKKLRNTKMSKKSRKTGGKESMLEWLSYKAKDAKEDISNKYKDVKENYNESTFGSDTVNKISGFFTRKKSKQIDAIINLIKNAKKLGEDIHSDTLPDLPNNLIDLIKTDGNLKVLNQATEYWEEHELKIIIGEIIDNFPEPTWKQSHKTHLKILVIIVLIDKRPLILNDKHHLKFISEIKEQSIDVFQDAGNTYDSQQYDYLKDILKNKMDPPIKFPTEGLKTTNYKGKDINYIEGEKGKMLQTPDDIIDEVLRKELIINYIKKQTGERTEGGKSKKLRKSSKTRRKSNKKRSTKRSRK